MTAVELTGLLRHRFWGEYSCVLALEAPDQAAAIDAARTLGAGWELKTLPDDGRAALVRVCDTDTSDAVLEALAAYRAPDDHCDRCGEIHELGDVAHSIDYSTPFRLLVPVTPHEQTAFSFNAAGAADRPTR